MHIFLLILKKNETDIFNGYEILEKKGTAYDEIFKKQLSLINQYGYPFLNSKTCNDLLDEMHDIEENVLSEINNSRLSYHYNADKELNDKREIEMLRNIYNYSKQS